MRRLGRSVWLGVALLALSGATRPGDRPPPVLIAGVPHIRQEPDFCGEACVAMASRKLGHNVGQDAVFDAPASIPRLGKGANTRGAEARARSARLPPGAVWYDVDAAHAGAGLDARSSRRCTRTSRAACRRSSACTTTTQPGHAGALPPRPRLRPRDERGHLNEPARGRGRVPAHAARALPRAVAAQVRRRDSWTVIRFAWTRRAIDDRARAATGVHAGGARRST